MLCYMQSININKNNNIFMYIKKREIIILFIDYYYNNNYVKRLKTKLKNICIL